MVTPALSQDVLALMQVITQLKTDLQKIQPADITSQHIVTATDELDAIVEATADATGTIMDACEGIENTAGTLSTEAQQAVTDHVTKIYEACSFQDITGQRITKVVKALKQIENKVQDMLLTLGPLNELTGDMQAQTTTLKTDPDQALLNGPQLKGQGMDQDDIDKLLFG